MFRSDSLALLAIILLFPNALLAQPKYTAEIYQDFRGKAPALPELRLQGRELDTTATTLRQHPVAGTGRRSQPSRPVRVPGAPIGGSSLLRPAVGDHRPTVALDVSGSIGATPLGRTESSATVLWVLGERPARMRDGSCREHPEVDFFPERARPGSVRPLPHAR